MQYEVIHFPSSLPGYLSGSLATRSNRACLLETQVTIVFHPLAAFCTTQENEAPPLWLTGEMPMVLNVKPVRGKS